MRGFLSEQSCWGFKTEFQYCLSKFSNCPAPSIFSHALWSLCFGNSRPQEGWEHDPQGGGGDSAAPRAGVGGSHCSLEMHHRE